MAIPMHQSTQIACTQVQTFCFCKEFITSDLVYISGVQPEIFSTMIKLNCYSCLKISLFASPHAALGVGWDCPEQIVLCENCVHKWRRMGLKIIKTSSSLDKYLPIEIVDPNSVDTLVQNALEYARIRQLRLSKNSATYKQSIDDALLQFEKSLVSYRTAISLAEKYCSQLTKLRKNTEIESTNLNR